MPKLLGVISSGQAIALGVVIVGCSTAAVVTGHLSGADFLTVVGLVGGGAVGVTGAHVGANAALSGPTLPDTSMPTPAPVAPPAPAPTQEVTAA